MVFVVGLAVSKVFESMFRGETEKSLSFTCNCEYFFLKLGGHSTVFWIVEVFKRVKNKAIKPLLEQKCPKYYKNKTHIWNLPYTGWFVPQITWLCLNPFTIQNSSDCCHTQAKQLSLFTPDSIDWLNI